MAQPELWLCRHGETAWSRDGRHTSHTDLPLTSAGADEARQLRRSLAGVAFNLVLTSPLRRATDTAALLGFPDARRDPALVEWDYGDYEGMTTAAIREKVADWTVWTQESPGGESADEVAARADRVIDRVLGEATGRALVVSHGHFLRVLAARWIGESAPFGRRLLLATATVSVLGWERDVRAIARWNAPAGEAEAGPAVGPTVEPGLLAGDESGSGDEPSRP